MDITHGYNNTCSNDSDDPCLMGMYLQVNHCNSLSIQETQEIFAIYVSIENSENKWSSCYISDHTCNFCNCHTLLNLNVANNN